MGELIIILFPYWIWHCITWPVSDHVCCITWTASDHICCITWL